MKDINSWLDEYGVSHKNPINKAIHWICVPIIYFSVIGLLAEIPVPSYFASESIYCNFATLGLVISAIYYFMLSKRLSIGMIAFLCIIGCVLFYMLERGMPVWEISLFIFVVAWIAQFVGHNIEGKKPSFFKDLQFLMIGPIWLMSFIYKKLGINY